jgi:hypothetical protein
MKMQAAYAPLHVHTNMHMWNLGNSDVLMEEIILRDEIANLEKQISLDTNANQC